MKEIRYEIKKTHGNSIEIIEKGKSSCSKELVYIAKSLVKKLEQESAINEPEKTLLHFARMQKDDLKYEIDGLSDLEITMKSSAMKIKQNLQSIFDENIKVQQKHYDDYFDKMKEMTEEFKNKMKQVIPDEVKTDIDNVEKLNNLSDKIKGINTYELENLITVLNKLGNLTEKQLDIITKCVK